jgi:uncharacterized protein YegP (UPF0339 family)
MAGKFTVYLDKSNKYRFNLKAGNGEIIAVGESYPDKKSCLKGIESIKKNAPVAPIVDNTAAPKTEKAKTVKAKTTKAKAPAKAKSAPKKKAAPAPKS